MDNFLRPPDDSVLMWAEREREIFFLGFYLLRIAFYMLLIGMYIAICMYVGRSTTAI